MLLHHTIGMLEIIIVKQSLFSLSSLQLSDLSQANKSHGILRSCLGNSRSMVNHDQNRLLNGREILPVGSDSYQVEHGLKWKIDFIWNVI
jgi:hypothetical protein